MMTIIIKTRVMMIIETMIATITIILIIIIMIMIMITMITIRRTTLINSNI